MRRLLIVPLVAGAAFLSSVLAAPAFGEPSGTVNATVSTTLSCITLETNNISFGSAPFSTANGMSVKEVIGPTATNCGTASSILASATNASGTGASWTLVPASNPGAGCTPGGDLVSDNQFALLHRIDLFNPVVALSSTPVAVATNVAPNGTHPYSLELFMPCDGSSGGGVTMSFGITFTAVAN